MTASSDILPAQAVDAARVQHMPEQIGAFCYRRKAGELQFLLVTSSRGRWILPKGWPEKKMSARKVAAMEAWEEAGVKTGKVSKKPLLHVMNLKTLKSKGPIYTRVAVHGIKVKKAVDTFPECRRRKRKWVTLKQSKKLVKDKPLRKALAQLVAATSDDLHKKLDA